MTEHDTHTDSSVDDITNRALAKARQEFERREALTRETIKRAIAAFQSIDHHSQALRAARAELDASLDELAGLDVSRAVIAESLGVTESTLSRRLPEKRKSRRTQTASRSVQSRTSENG